MMTPDEAYAAFIKLIEIITKAFFFLNLPMPDNIFEAIVYLDLLFAFTVAFKRDMVHCMFSIE